MTDTTTAAETFTYQIRIKGLLHDRWADWFNGLTLTRIDDGETVLTAVVPDQAALRGIINGIWDLNLPIISIARVQ